MGECVVRPLSEWVQEPGNGKDCRPCGLAAIVGDYQEQLQDSGYPELAEKIGAAFTGDGDVILKVAQAMDEVKTKVSEGVRRELLEIDSLPQCSDENNEKGGDLDVS